MKDRYNREITYMRISVTDRCNFRCSYCMPNDGILKKEHNDILSFEEIVEIAKIATSLGIKKIRLTGGEPFARKGFLDLVKMLGQINGLKKLALTSNGSFPTKSLYKLKEYGLSSINFSLDTLDRKKFKDLCNKDDFNLVIENIKRAYDMGFKVKINTVLIKGINDHEISDFIKLSKDMDIDIRFIELMPIGYSKNLYENSFMENLNILDGYEYENIDDDGVANLYKIKDHKGKIGLISPLSHKFCSNCNRIRLTSDGKIKPCLHSKEEINIKGLSIEEKRKTLAKAIFLKDQSHNLLENGSKSIRNMNQIGG